MQPFLREPPLGRGPFFSVWHRKEDEIRFAWHYHEAYELTLIVGSQGRRLVGDSESTYEAGDLVLVGPGVPHTYASTPGGHTAHEQIVTHFDRRLFGESALHDPQMAPLNDLLNAAAKGVLFAGTVSRRLLPLFLRLPTERPLVRLATFCTLLDALSETPAHERTLLSALTFGPTSNRADPQPIQKISRFLEDNFHKQISLIQAARLVAMSPSAFSRFFKASTGHTFVEYVNELRLRHASRLLLETDRGVADIAAASGFPNVSYFNRRFLAAKNLRPSDYRESIRKLRPTGLPPR
ncbi:MAG: AraC family transcriptional regulator [Deltaproteobacteria bacterium]|nr:AraC family transcriptional regulator [Deltaproteobacteria bacterium]